ncbi:hypothetical protein AB0C06_23285 [Micromonospora inaquosa]|uniref:YCII-related domain-containing protein n=1 Tax=Micromonospora inaquosa TaxID=2203716 RepID=A0A3N9WCQ9_9ACTN|nr:hypothetical protein [Micromonospora inaquosa]RQW98665.1 hypothetical protein DLJ59_26715 [Micromonospora inaquosa]
MANHLFVLEQYYCSADAGTAAPLITTLGCRLVATIRLPTDDVVIALVEGPNAEAVAEAAAVSAWRVDRLIPARWIHPPQASTTIPDVPRQVKEA